MNRTQENKQMQEFMNKLGFTRFDAFVEYFNKLRERNKSTNQLYNENEALKETIAVILAQKREFYIANGKLRDQVVAQKKEIDELKKMLAKEIKQKEKLQLPAKLVRVLGTKEELQEILNHLFDLDGDDF